MVGAPGFEPGTSCAQGKRATRLRHAPKELPPGGGPKRHEREAGNRLTNARRNSALFPAPAPHHFASLLRECPGEIQILVLQRLSRCIGVTAAVFRSAGDGWLRLGNRFEYHRVPVALDHSLQALVQPIKPVMYSFLVRDRKSVV